MALKGRKRGHARATGRKPLKTRAWERDTRRKHAEAKVLRSRKEHEAHVLKEEREQ